MIVAVDRDAERPGRTSVAFAMLEELVEQLLLAGTTKPDLVDAHAKIVFVAAVRDIDVGAGAEAHRLRIIEPGARRRGASYGTAPVISPSTRNCCKRHSVSRHIEVLPSAIRKAVRSISARPALPVPLAIVSGTREIVETPPG